MISDFLQLPNLSSNTWFVVEEENILWKLNWQQIFENAAVAAVSFPAHTHDQYSLLTHNHNNYALIVHTHTDYAPTNHTHNYAQTDHTHATYALTVHTHTDYAPTTHNHDTRYALAAHNHDDGNVYEIATIVQNALQPQLQQQLSGFAPTVHYHTGYAPTAHLHNVADITNLVATVETAIQASAAVAHVHDYSSLSNIPTSFTPATHTHSGSEVLGSTTPSAHTHSMVDLTDYQPAIPGYHTHRMADITDAAEVVPTEPIAHTHTMAQITDLSNLQLPPHTHNAPTLDNWQHTHSYGELVNTQHTHSLADLSDYESLTTTMDLLRTTDWAAIVSAATTAAETTHNHDASYAPLAHTHTLAEITDADSLVPPPSTGGGGNILSYAATGLLNATTSVVVQHQDDPLRNRLVAAWQTTTTNVGWLQPLSAWLDTTDWLANNALPTPTWPPTANVWEIVPIVWLRGTTNYVVSNDFTMTHNSNVVTKASGFYYPGVVWESATTIAAAQPTLLPLYWTLQMEISVPIFPTTATIWDERQLGNDVGRFCVRLENTTVALLHGDTVLLRSPPVLVANTPTKIAITRCNDVWSLYVGNARVAATQLHVEPHTFLFFSVGTDYSRNFPAANMLLSELLLVIGISCYNMPTVATWLNATDVVSSTTVAPSWIIERPESFYTWYRWHDQNNGFWRNWGLTSGVPAWSTMFGEQPGAPSASEWGALLLNCRWRLLPQFTEMWFLPDQHGLLLNVAINSWRQSPQTSICANVSSTVLTASDASTATARLVVYFL